MPARSRLSAPRGIKTDDRQERAAANATEDDITGSISGTNQGLLLHCQQTEKKSEQFAAQAGLSQERILDLKAAAHLHDAGKADPRFQAWLASDDPLGPDSNRLLAKSARRLPRNPREYSGLPPRWRHEALSVRLAPHIPRFQEARDPELVLWLVGTHHGYGRPFFPHSDVEDARERTNLPDVLDIPHNTLEAGAGPQSLAFDWKGLDWPGLYECLKVRYGVWELARMEAILRLADHPPRNKPESMVRPMRRRKPRNERCRDPPSAGRIGAGQPTCLFGVTRVAESDRIVPPGLDAKGLLGL